MRNVPGLKPLLLTAFDTLLYFLSVGLGLLISGLAYAGLRTWTPGPPEGPTADPLFWPLQTLGVVGPTCLLWGLRRPETFRACLRPTPEALVGGARGLLLGLGCAGLAAALVLLWPAGLAPGPGPLKTLWVHLNVALAEEAVFRGYLWALVELRLGVRAAHWATGLLFALAHGANPGLGPLAPLNLLLAGLLLGALRRNWGFWAAVGWHLGWNFGLGGLFGLPVSGLSFPGLVRLFPTAPEFWAGGAFGPEGGLAGTAVLAGALVGAGGWGRAAGIILKVRRVLR
mgnify:CR=1 FL=1